MNKSVRMLSALVAIIMLLSVLGCGGGGGGRNALFAKWKDTTDTIWEFKSDGNLIIGQDPISFPMKYEFVNDTTIKITDDGGLGFLVDQQIVWSVAGETLTLSVAGETTTLTRVP
jgi:hypothetical protein